MTLSRGFKDAFRVALAMVIVYGIILAQGWSNPHWGGLAVAMCGLSTAGEFLRKGLLRIGGTLVAVVVSLTLIALFPQDRWLFCLFLSVPCRLLRLHDDGDLALVLLAGRRLLGADVDARRRSYCGQRFRHRHATGAGYGTRHRRFHVGLGLRLAEQQPPRLRASRWPGSSPYRTSCSLAIWRWLQVLRRPST